jgi:hypothetical protein
MKEALDKMLERLETQYVAKQGKLGEARQKLKGRAMQLTRTTRDLENKIESGSIACLLSENGELRKDVLDKLEEVCTSAVNHSLPTSDLCLSPAAIYGDRAHA